LRSELRPHGVRVSIVYPPDTDTPGFAEENRTKPPETAAISGSVAPRSADEVARAIVRGIEHDRFTIVADPTTGLLARTAGLVSPLVHRYADRVVRRVRERGHAPPRGGGAAGTAPPEDDRGRPDAPRWW